MKPNKKMPVLFVGHGSPMFAIEENEFTDGFKKVAKLIPKPKAILSISAHWITKGSFVTAMDMPKTIHDFYGFPQELFDVNYPASGSKELAIRVKKLISEVTLDTKWGLDHGTWSVLKHMYPNADIPVIQLSIDGTKDARYHYELAKSLEPLREEGILIVGSGNIVHNLNLVDFRDKNAHKWAEIAQEKISNFIQTANHEALINYKSQGREFLLSIPTPEHFLPLLYILGLQKNEDIKIFNDKIVLRAIGMHSVLVG